MIIRIGDRYYRLEAGALVALDSPPEDTEDVFDGDAVINETDRLEMADFRTLAEQARTAVTEARAEAVSAGTAESRTALQIAAARNAVLDGEYRSRVEMINAATGDLGDLPEPPANTTDSGTDADSGNGDNSSNSDADGGDADGGDAAGNGDAGTADGATGDNGDAGDNGDDAGDPGLAALAADPNVAALVTAAAQAAVQAAASPAVVQAAGRGAPIFAQTPILDRGGNAGPEVVQAAGFTAMASPLANAGEPLVDDDMFYALVAQRENDLRAVVASGDMSQQVARVPQVRYNMFDDATPRFDGSMAATFRGARQASAAARTGVCLSCSSTRRTAAGETCPSCDSSPDVRRVIPDCGVDENPLGNILERYPSPHCKLEYYKAMPMEMDVGGTWGKEEQAAFCEARDKYLDAQKDGDPGAIAEAFANLKSTEKTCYQSGGCAPSDVVSPDSTYVCWEYPVEWGDCNPEMVPVVRRNLERAFKHKQNKKLLTDINEFSIPVDVDAAAKPFVGADGQIGAQPVVSEVLGALQARGEVAEFTTGGNYRHVVELGFARYLMSDDAKRCYAETGSLDVANADLSNILGIPTIVVRALPDDAGGIGGAWGAQNLPATIRDGGEAVPFAELQYPCDWTSWLVNFDDFFEVTRPEINVGVTVVPDYLKQNMVFAMFMESHSGVGKDGCLPTWRMDWSNLANNGARSGCIAPPEVC